MKGFIQVVEFEGYEGEYQRRLLVLYDRGC